MLGMKVDNAGGKWTVISTSASSVAERSGVLASDIIESINDQAIGGKDKLNGTVLGKALTVLRGGKSIKLDLKR
jgi:C-terminal processing protease CtpA/Prc